MSGEIRKDTVLLPYEITLLSNAIFVFSLSRFVLLPYEITLLSNTSTANASAAMVLLPYEITLLSNCPNNYKNNYFVLLPYEITLLSNITRLIFTDFFVLLPYEITLLSNRTTHAPWLWMFYYLMKLHYSQTSNENKLRHYNSQGNIIKWLYYKPKIIFLQRFRTYLYPKYKDFLAEVSESCFDFQ